MKHLNLRFVTIMLLLFATVGLSTLVAKVSADDENSARFEFVGPINALPSSGLIGDWTVGTRTVHVSSSTRIDQEDGSAAVGALVEVEGTLKTDGTVDATKIEVQEEPEPSPSPTPSPSPGCHEFEGKIQALPNTTGFIGDWVVDNLTIHVTSSTQIRTEDGATVALGAPVEVTGCLRQDGSVDAMRIEVERIRATNPPCFEFFGRIENLPSTPGFIGDWTVGQRTIHVTATTILRTEEGNIAVGALVEVKGCLQADGSLNATLIEVERRAPGDNTPFFEFFGTVQMLPVQGTTGDWVVSGRTVHVTNGTEIEPRGRPLVVGSFVRVVGALQTDGSINATSIQVKRSNDTGRRVNFFEFFGQVNALPSGSTLVGDWTVSHVTVHVTQDTKIVREDDQPLVVGARVLVVGTQRPDLTLNAKKIRVLESVESAENFVKQNYDDFLNREPDQGGLAYWSNQITGCGNDQDCISRRRTEVSAAFFISDEFQKTGFFVYRMYAASFGRRPRFVEFLPDTLTVAQNLGGGPAVLEANKQAFVEDWVRHPSFTAIYDSKTNTQYVDMIFANAEITPSVADRLQLIQELTNGTGTRASVLQKIAENPAFREAEFNRAFVLMQYFGYLRREPDEGGYQFWLNVLNNRVPGNFKAMVCAFATSAEYQLRFAATFTHTDRECGR